MSADDHVESFKDGVAFHGEYKLDPGDDEFFTTPPPGELDAPPTPTVPGRSSGGDKDRSHRPPIPTEDRRCALEALRDELADRIPEASDRDVVALTKQLQSVLAELSEISPADTSGLDDLEALLNSGPA